MHTPLPIPVIETERLLLRAPRPDDFAAHFAMWTHPAVTKFILGRPSTQEEVWARLLRYIGHWAVFGFGFWIIEDRVTGALMGEVGFSDFHREVEPPFGDTPEMGWSLAPAGQGRGIATEAVLAALAWADQRFTPARTVCLIDPENAPSLRVAAKAGFRETARTTYKGSPTIAFERYGPSYAGLGDDGG